MIALAAHHMMMPDRRSTTLSTKLEMMDMEPDRILAASLAISRSYKTCRDVR